MTAATFAFRPAIAMRGFAMPRGVQTMLDYAKYEVWRLRRLAGELGRCKTPEEREQKIRESFGWRYTGGFAVEEIIDNAFAQPIAQDENAAAKARRQMEIIVTLVSARKRRSQSGQQQDNADTDDTENDENDQNPPKKQGQKRKIGRISLSYTL